MKTMETRKKARSSYIKSAVAIALLVALCTALCGCGSSSSAAVAEVKPTLAPVTEPKSGAILVGSEAYNESELTIAASGGQSCVVKLKTSSGVTRLSFYVRAGDTVTVGVPNEYLYVYFASGDTWYGEKNLFGEDTSYSMDDEICDFANYTWEYTLYPVTNGNFSETPIGADDF
jgi:hypothetical protein